MHRQELRPRDRSDEVERTTRFVRILRLRGPRHGRKRLPREEKNAKVESQGIDPRTSRMLSERSAI